jgi:16S rRNA processing protein RimM
MKADRWVALAEIARPHGIKGELKLAVYNLESDVLLRRPKIRLVLGDGSVRRDAIRSVRRVPGAMLARLESVADRDQAEALRGARVEVPREELGEAADGEYFHCDLEGCEARLDGVGIGAVARVVSYPTCDALVVLRDGHELEVPLTPAYVARIDVSSGIIELIALPE